MHPDKNHAAGAEEAFKKLSEAFACLVDPVTQAAYLNIIVRKLRLGGKKRSRETSTARPHKKPCPDPSLFVPKRTEEYENNFKEAEIAFMRQVKEQKEILQRKKQLEQQRRAERDASRIDRLRETLLPGEEETDNHDINMCHAHSDYYQWQAWKVNNVNGPPAVSTSPAERQTKPRKICQLCQRAFATENALNMHVSMSKLHMVNLQLASLRHILPHAVRGSASVVSASAPLHPSVASASASASASAASASSF